MNIFADQHHAGLYNSLHLTLEVRLGHRLFRPIGTEWLDKGYWRIAEIYNNHPSTVAQFLYTPSFAVEVEKGIFKIWETAHNFWEYGMTYEAFMRIKPQVVIATVPEHIESFKRLANEVGSKMVYQLGNNWPASAGLADNIMASARIDDFPKTGNVIQYHQEFSEDIFKYKKSEPENKIYSFINCLNTASIYTQDWRLFEEVERLMPDWEFKSFGGSCRDGSAHGQNDVAKMMNDCKFVWHTKNGGDGYGHILYNSACMGKPTIIKLDYYKGKLGEELLEDGVTCIAIDNMGLQAITDKINYYAENTRYYKLCENVNKRFKDRVNFEKEAEMLRNFIGNLI